MTVTIFRGRLLDFTDEPMHGETGGGYRYIEDGALAVVDGIRLRKPCSGERRRCSLPAMNTAVVGGSQERICSASSSTSTATTYGGSGRSVGAWSYEGSTVT